jgi:hypothetical protein
MQISLPAHAGQTAVNIQASSIKLILYIPPQVAARIQTRNELTMSEIDLTRFPKTGQAGEYMSAEYDVADNRVDIHMEFSGGPVKIGSGLTEN